MPLPAALSRARFPGPVLHVLRLLDEAGHRSFVVGGAVRDLLLGRVRVGGDFDLATPATPKQVMGLFPRVIPTGVEHGTVTIVTPDKHKVEVTTFRGEGAYLDGRRPESVTFHTDLVEDLARRDFTVNALAFDPLRQELFDPFGGRADLKARLIRAVGEPAERFGEDGLRPVRAVRFAAELGFRLHPRTRAAIRGALPVVRRVSLERVAEEVSRLAVAPHLVEAVDLLLTTGLLEAVLPPLALLAARRVRHLGRVAAQVSGTPPDLVVRLAALLHGVPAAEVEPGLSALRLPRKVAAEAGALVARHSCLADGPPEDPVSPAVVRRWLSGVGPGRAAPLLALRDAEVAALPPARRPAARAAARRLRQRLEEALASGAPLDTGALALDGRGLMQLLGCPPGPHVGEGLRALLDLVLDDPRLNTPEALADEARRWWTARAV